MAPLQAARVHWHNWAHSLLHTGRLLCWAVRIAACSLFTSCTAHLEDLAAATTPHTLQLVVAHTLHKHSLGVLLGPQLPHSLLLLLLRRRLVVVLLLWWSLLLLLGQCLALLLMLGWCLSLLLLLLLNLRFRCLCCLALPLLLWRLMGLLAYCCWVRLLGSRGLLLLLVMWPGLLLLLLYRGSLLPLHLLRLLGALLCSLCGHCCLGCSVHMCHLLLLFAWSFRLGGSRRGTLLRLQRPADSRNTKS